MELAQVLQARVEALRARRAELESRLAEGGGRPDYARWSREYGRLGKQLEVWERYERLGRELEEARGLAREGEAGMRELAEEEAARLEAEHAAAEKEVLDLFLDTDEDLGREAIVEIRAGTGGEEAALFAADLYRIYERFAAVRGWSLELLDAQATELGGFKEISFQVAGEESFRFLRFESGTHRVQRVPATETQGRIHTSAATVAVLPAVEEVDFELRPEDLEISAMRSSGPGGQHVNKTSSAVRVVHLPTGLSVKCQEEKSQLRNKEKALALLRSRLYEQERRRREEERKGLRRSQVGSGDRSGRIRTYNWPQNRVTDHRVGQSFSLEQVLEGRLDPILEALLEQERARRLAEL